MSTLSEKFATAAKTTVLARGFLAGAGFAGVAGVVAAGALAGATIGSILDPAGVAQRFTQVSIAPLNADDFRALAEKMIYKEIEARQIADEHREAARKYLTKHVLAEVTPEDGARVLRKKVGQLSSSAGIRRAIAVMKGQDVANVVATGRAQSTKAPATARFSRTPKVSS